MGCGLEGASKVDGEAASKMVGGSCDNASHKGV